MTREIKAVVLGDDYVGKTSLILNHSYKVPHLHPTETLVMKLEEQEYSLLLCDTEDRDYPRLRQLLYAETDVFLICFSLAGDYDPERVVTKWAPEIRHFFSDARICLVGTKLDRRGCETKDVTNFQALSYRQGLQLARKISAWQYIECSARTHKGVHAVFREAIKVAIAPDLEQRSTCQCM